MSIGTKKKILLIPPFFLMAKKNYLVFDDVIVVSFMVKWSSWSTPNPIRAKRRGENEMAWMRRESTAIITEQ